MSMRSRSVRQLLPALLVPAVLAVPAGALSQGAAAAADAPWSARVNTGAGTLTGSDGRVWSADRAYVGGGTATTTATISGTTEQALYRSERYGMSAYRLAVPSTGTYRVKLHMAEITFGAAGRRVFSVTGEGRPVVTDLDLFAKVGKNRAHVVTSDVTVTDGVLDLGFSARTNNATVAAIEVTALPPVVSTRVNAGSGLLTGSDGRVWSADTGYVGGGTGSTTSTISGTTEQALYRTERWGASGYRLPVPAAGTYRVALHMAEITFTSAGQRVFSVAAEGAPVVTDLDLVARVGAKRAHVVTSDVAVTDGTLDLAFTAKANHATVAGIEATLVAPASTTTSPAPTAPAPTAPVTTSPVTTAPTTAPGGLTLDGLAYDHYGAPFRTDSYFGAPWGAHEARPLGVPSSWDFYHGARPGHDFPTTTYNATSGWGQVAEDSAGSPVKNVRVQVRNFRMFFLQADGKWVEARPGADDRMIEGAYWTGTYEALNAMVIRDEATNGGGSSASLAPVGGNHTDGRTRRFAHFWWKSWFPREPIPAGAKGEFVMADMRLIPDTDPTVDLTRARFVASTSADVYHEVGAVTDRNNLISQPRMKYVTPAWKTFTGHNLTEAELRATPPPVLP